MRDRFSRRDADDAFDDKKFIGAQITAIISITECDIHLIFADILYCNLFFSKILIKGVDTAEKIWYYISVKQKFAASPLSQR